ncbi:conjugal transfer protein TraF [Neiella marina]|uniref:Conjugal transfer protein TraF n=1 Tax=Neiella holothuriorum TaxID=2870530 RepID=A0ABS7EHL9_9GAMM|nr:conjugal transfer protein TraF [Neiella holothuriorum]MBW8191393.1 conjugal transfer protein TraF [Neiella holothuriorum]
MQLLRLGLTVLLTVTAFQISAKPIPNSGEGNFYDDKERGWYHFERDIEPDEPEEQEEPPVAPPPPPETEPQKTVEPTPDTTTIVINAQWLRDNLPVLLDGAMNNPTDRNLSAYYYAQRMAADMSTRFGMRTREFFEKETMLSEEHRRPTKAFVLNQHADQTRQNRKQALEQVFNQAGLWMFFVSDCGYCHQQTPVMNELARQHGANVLYISLDGNVLPNHPDLNYRDDSTGAVRDRFGIQIQRTPTILLVKNDGSEAIVISEGMIPLSDLEQTVLAHADDAGWLDEGEYLATQEVRNVTAIDEQAPVEVTVPSGNESTAPEALVELMKKRLNKFDHSSAKKFEE